MNKIKISSHQLRSLVAIYTCGTTILVGPTHLAKIAKQDTWIVSIVATVIGLLFIWINTYLGSLYPEKTYVEIICTVFGKWIGGVVAAGFIFFSFLAVPQTVANIYYFIAAHLLPSTPPYAIDALFLIVVVIALLYGLEAIARSAEVSVFIISIMFIAEILLVSKSAQTNNLLPILEKGIGPVFKSSLYLLSDTVWPLIVINMIFPMNIINIKEAKKSIFAGYLWGSFLVFLSTIMSVLVLGSTITAEVRHPTYLLAKEINVGIIITRIEGIFVWVWIVTIFFQTIMYFHATLIGFSQLTGLKDYRKLVLPFALVILMLSDVVYPDYIYLIKYDTTTWIPYVFTFGVILPILLLIFTRIKKSSKAEKSKKKACS